MSLKNRYPFIIAFVLLIAVIIINRINFKKAEDFSVLVDHTREVITSFEELANHFKSAQIYTPVYADVVDKSFYNLYKREAESVTGDIQKLNVLIKDNPIQVKRIDTLQKLINRQLDVLGNKNVDELIEAGQAWRLHWFFIIQQVINEGIQHERNLLAIRKLDREHANRNSEFLTFLFEIIATALIVLSFGFNLSLTRKGYWLEGFLKSILDTSQNGIVTYKAIRTEGKITDFKIEFANATVETLLKIKPKTIIGKRLKTMPSFIVESGLLEKYIYVVETGEQIEFETLYKRDGHQVWLNLLLAKLGDGLTATLYNITDLKKYEGELTTKIQQLEESNNQLEQFAYIASHDLQEPLRKIRTFSDRLQMQNNNLNEESKNWLDRIVTSADRMTILIKDLLNYSRLAQTKEKEFSKLDLNKALKNVLSDLDLAIQQKEAQLIIEPLPTIDAIELQINQLFYNLLSNSLKFAAQDRPLKICIRCSVLSAEEKEQFHLNTGKEYTRIKFQDNGIGFKQNFTEQIFEIFQRLNTKEQYPGTGIGLALCRKVAENHHGFIYAEGKEGAGATFTILLPVEQDV